MTLSRFNPVTRLGLSAWALGALCCAWLAQPAQAQVPQSQAAQLQAAQSQVAQAAAREQGAATRQQTRKTDQANRAAAVEDETSTAAQAARTAQSEAAQFEATQRRNAGGAAPSYGPVLTPRGQLPADSTRKDPAEVHDETDSQTRPAAPPQSSRPSSQSSRSVQEPQASQQARPPAAPRRAAWQAAAEPLAPRPLRPAENTASVPVPVPAPVTPPRPVGPTSNVIGSCAGNVCRDTNGNTYNGIGTGTAGVNSSGRLCTRTGTTVQCF